MRTLVIGGAASGKSEYAEELAINRPMPRFYIATMMPGDDESLKRIERHHKMREKKGFLTIEQYYYLAHLSFSAHGTALLEDIGNLAANEMFARKSSRDDVVASILEGIFNLEAQCDDLIVVTNDVFADGSEYTEGTLRYIEALGTINRILAARFERVIETVCGIPLILKGDA